MFLQCEETSVTTHYFHDSISLEDNLSHLDAWFLPVYFPGREPESPFLSATIWMYARTLFLTIHEIREIVHKSGSLQGYAYENPKKKKVARLKCTMYD
ncbi:hypothetical protein Taro_014262 [Colocasia esculenta]|uniref:Uncharacterized protein n=1 Tax=Colocasia esculenta TaxID=4460 RepID=A0A843UIW3_COLES|nr:hypothetical protein [Colocasia esculenta]